MIIKYTDFPVRPLMSKGESLAGYFYRLYAANGYQMPLKVVKDLYHGGDSARTDQAFNQLKSTMGNAVDIDMEWWLRSRSMFAPEWRPMRRIWQKLSCYKFRICPVCINESGVHFTLWELSLIQACPVHQCHLLDQCTDCHRDFSWNNLEPDWICSCGKSMASMSINQATSSMVKMAKLLVFANDVAPPTRLQNHFGDHTESRYSLADIYEGLNWIGKLRVLIKNNSRYYRYFSIRKFKGIAWREPQFLMVSLLADSNEQISKLLLRILKRSFRKISTSLYFVGESDNFMQIARFLEIAESNLFQTKICKVIEHIERQFLLELPMQARVIYNPYISEQRRLEMQIRLVDEWRRLSTHIGELDPKIYRHQRDIIKPIAFRNSDRNREIVFLLNALLNVTQHSLEIEAFQALLYWWRIPKELREIGNPNEVLELIGAHLSAIPDYELYFVGSLIRLALQEESKY